ncbi:MAG: acetate--CoA ligase family protein [Candidatus Heimdallarchaeaceae archaeon]
MIDSINNIFKQLETQNRSALTYEESRKVLSYLGVPFNKMETVKELDECKEIAEKIGYPLVLKIISEDVIHKSDAGGVKIGIKDEQELEESYFEILGNVRKFYPKAKIEGLSVEELVKGVELLIGVNTDKQFGKMIALGIGGIFVEVYKDISFRLIPVTSDDVKEMINEIKGKKLFSGFRGLPKVNESELIDLILKISNFIEKFPIVQELDLNPVVATETGLEVVDARIILG